MFHWEIETDVAIKIPIHRRARIPFVCTPNLAAEIGIARKNRRPRWCITRSVNGAIRPRRSGEQTVCVDNEPSEIRVLQNRFQARSITAFRQPKSIGFTVEKFDIRVAPDQNLRTRCASRLLLDDWQQAVCCCAGDDFQRTRFSQLTKDRQQITFPFIHELAVSFRKQTRIKLCQLAELRVFVVSLLFAISEVDQEPKVPNITLA